MRQARHTGRRERFERRPSTGEGGVCRPADLPTITVALADPVIRTMMRADHVDPGELEQALRAMARKLADQGRLGEGSGAR